MLEGSEPAQEEIQCGPRTFVQHILTHRLIREFRIQKTNATAPTSSAKKKKAARDANDVTTPREANDMEEDEENPSSPCHRGIFQALSADGKAFNVYQFNCGYFHGHTKYFPSFFWPHECVSYGLLVTPHYLLSILYLS